MFKKCFSIGIAVIITLFSLAFVEYTASAHSGANCNSGSESTGWIVNCSNPGHAGTSSYTYRLDPALDTAYAGYTNVGVNRWNDTGVTNITQAVSSDNLVTSHGGPDEDVVATTRSWYNSSTSHKDRWEISYNTYVMNDRSASQNNGTAAHEMGHTIGLADLYENSNSNKLMYGYSSRTVTSPTSSDIAGAREAVQ
ncbi:hypothetical protein [Oceanobacillus timonensis]|uniref:hypothetical protein n=1 Tax=Oceanobacillus timonensis TaxID=1926285 RepID=UPI0009BAD3E9|nr:hypothetical protein [Oceanobacillus timonensis]